VFSGLFHLALWQLVVVTLGLTHLTIVAVTLYLHRCQAHRALDMHPALAHFFRAWLYLTTGMSTRQWVAVHRLHHAKCDTDLDPHSPQTKGLFNIMTKGALYYAQTARDPDVISRYGHGAPNDWLETRLYSRHIWLGIASMAILDTLAFGAIPGLAIWATQMLWIPFWAAGVVNGVGHFFGYRNADSLDASTNISPWGIIIGGEELHNNHHLYPTSAKLSVKPFEFDIGWAYLRILAAMQLVTIKKVTPVWHRPADSNSTPSLEAFVTHRFEILAQYSRHLKRLYRLEYPNAATSLRLRLGFWKYLDTLRLRPDCKTKLAILRAGNGALSKALELREDLVAIWANRQASKEQSQQALSAWIARVEASEIRELDAFVTKLRRLPQEAGP